MQCGLSELKQLTVFVVKVAAVSINMHSSLFRSFVVEFSAFFLVSCNNFFMLSSGIIPLCCLLE